VNEAQRARARAQCRRPIVDEVEVSHLDALGAALRAIRRAAGVSQHDLAARAEVNRVTLWRYEVGVRRPRASTLVRIATALAGAAPWVDAQEVTDTLVGLAGPALAEESPFADRVERRRDRRTERRERDAERARRRMERLWVEESFQRFLDEQERWEGRFLSRGPSFAALCANSDSVGDAFVAHERKVPSETQAPRARPPVTDR
jgi:transcriptional regulator with XRE-family HTH domain